ncbi:hypothetical protein B0H14DRAFT_1625218 [Mycena olivaceomarginata]|nr:hypothetical protein B0H14DRAFT_1625218 [Mycena olivaceomarginata]
MRRPYLTSDRLRLRFPMPHPQLDIGSLGPGEPAVVQNPASSSSEDDVAPQDDAPQNVQLVPSATQPAPSASSSDRAISGQSTQTGSTTSLGSTEAFTSTSAQLASATGLSSVTSSLTTSLVSLASPTTAASSSMYPLSLSSSVSSATPSASSSESVSPVSSSIAPSRASASASSSASPSATSAAAGPRGIGHDTAFYAGVALGVFILIACLATIIACLVRFRTRRREAAAVAAIAWDPVVAKPSSLELESDFSLTGDPRRR